MLSSEEIANLLSSSRKRREKLHIRPKPDIKFLRESGTASVDLRLGTWFSSMRQSKLSLLRVDDEMEDLAQRAALTDSQAIEVGEFIKGTVSANEANLMRSSYVPFGQRFVLHPRNFVLGVTLEWIRFPKNIAGYVIGKSSWGRRGLIIATAMGVHPNFTGCLTLELTNVAEVPIAIKPGMQICQLFLHKVRAPDTTVISSVHAGLRKPSLGPLRRDEFARRLSAPQ